MEGRNYGDLLLDYALSTGLTTRPTNESQQKSWFRGGYRYFVQKKMFWWFLKSRYTTVTDGTTKVPMPLDFRAFTHPKKILVGDVFYSPIPQDELARRTGSGLWPVVSLPIAGRFLPCYIDETDGTLTFLEAPASGETVTMTYIRRLGRVKTGTAQTGSSSTITLSTSSSSQNDVYNGMKIRITAGTGSGQVRTISDYVGSTKVATVSENWTTAPDSTSTFTIGDVLEVDNDVPSIPDDYLEALIEYTQSRRWKFLTEIETAAEHLQAADDIIAAAASEIGKRTFGQGDHRYGE